MLLLSETGDVRFHLRNNEAHSTLPFELPACADSVLVQTVAREHAQAMASGGRAHAHGSRLFRRPVWLGRRRFNTAAEDQVVVEPLPLWGSHDRETRLAATRASSAANCQIVRLQPQLVHRRRGAGQAARHSAQPQRGKDGVRRCANLHRCTYVTVERVRV